MKKVLKYLSFSLITLLIIKIIFNVINISFAIQTEGKKIETDKYKVKDLLIESFRKNKLNYLKQNDLNKIKKLSKEVKSINKAAGNPPSRASELWARINELDQLRQKENMIEDKKLSQKLGIQYQKYINDKAYRAHSDFSKSLFDHAIITKGLTDKINKKPTYSG